MIWLCEELEYAADKGYVIKLNEASEIYRALAEKSRIKIGFDSGGLCPTLGTC